MPRLTSRAERVKDFQLEKDLIEAYAHAAVKLIQEVERTWYKDASSGLL